MSDLPVVHIDRLEFTFAPRAWRFAETRRAEIESHFRATQQAKGALYNGRVLLMHRYALEGTTLRGEYLETDFASFLAWRDWGFPDADVKNCFALGALRGSDGGFLMGVMAPHTANAGRIYFPGGTPDPHDRIESRVDLERSVRREVEEETGVGAGDVAIAPGWSAVLAGPRIAMIKLMQAPEPAAALRRRILRHLASQTAPELADIHVVRGPGDLHAMMPPFIPAFLNRFWAQQREAGCAASRRGRGVPP
jgi:8-oxo-dGTP pyrophosphatase MutT (NUDIX family)